MYKEIDAPRGVEKGSTFNQNQAWLIGGMKNTLTCCGMLKLPIPIKFGVPTLLNMPCLVVSCICMPS